MICLINTFENASEFIATACKCDGEVDVKQGRYVVNGKSVIGVMSLNLAKPVEVTCSDAKDESLLSKFADEERSLEK